MFMKVFLPGALAIVGGTVYFSNGFGNDYRRSIDRPVPTVFSTLAGADLAAAAQTNGLSSVPQIRNKSVGADKMSFEVMTGSEVAMSMDLVLTALPGDTGTRVIGNLTEHDLTGGNSLPPQQTADAIQTLFDTAFDAKLDKLEPTRDEVRAKRFKAAEELKRQAEGAAPKSKAKA